MNTKPYWAVIIAATLAGASGVFVKLMSMPATSISFIRTAIPTLLLGGVMIARDISFFRGNYRLMLVASALNAVRMFLFFTAFIYTDIGKVVIILFTWPIFVTIFSVLFLGEIITQRRIFLLLLSFMGIVVVYANQPLSVDNKDFIGLSAALGTAVSYAITVTIFKSESNNYSRVELMFYQNLLSVGIFLPFFLLHRPWPSTQDWLLSSTHALLFGIVAFNFFFYGLRHLPASVAGLLAYIEIISAMLLGTFLLDEALTWNILLGGAIIISATLALRRK